MTDNITLPRETVSQLTRLFTDMQLSRLPSLWQVSTLLNILTAAPQQQAEPPSEWPLIKNILDEYGLQAISFVAEWKAAQQHAEPVSELQKRYLESEKAFQQQAEPVGEVTAAVDGAFKCEFSKHLPVGTKLYTAPPPRKPLTDDVVGFECRKHFWMHGTRFGDAYKFGFRDAEAAHGIKERNHV